MLEHGFPGRLAVFVDGAGSESEERVDGLTPKICDERADGLTHKIGDERVDGLCQIQIDGERVERLTCKIREERVDGFPFKIDAERADGWSATTGEERADGWTYQKVAERMIVDGDGSESGGIRWSHFMSPENTKRNSNPRERWAVCDAKSLGYVWLKSLPPLNYTSMRFDNGRNG